LTSEKIAILFQFNIMATMNEGKFGTSPENMSLSPLDTAAIQHDIATRKTEIQQAGHYRAPATVRGVLRCKGSVMNAIRILLVAQGLPHVKVLINGDTGIENGPAHELVIGGNEDTKLEASGEDTPVPRKSTGDDTLDEKIL
jgi:hypothetical protein